MIGGLREEEAPDVVGNLKDLFIFIFRKLNEADAEQDMGALDDALKILRQHQETWIELIEALPKEEEETSGRNDSTPAPGMSWET